MAQVELKLPDAFLEKLNGLGSEFDGVVEKVLQAGAEVVLSNVRSRLSSVVGSDTKLESRSTGELEGALGMSPVKQDRDGNHNVKIGFSEPRSDGKSNAMLANLLEYGKSGQTPKPFLKPAKTASRAACIAVMTAKLDEEVRGR